jgi:hypothetical protein
MTDSNPFVKQNHSRPQVFSLYVGESLYVCEVRGEIDLFQTASPCQRDGLIGRSTVFDLNSPC